MYFHLLLRMMDLVEDTEIKKESELTFALGWSVCVCVSRGGVTVEPLYGINFSGCDINF